MRAGVALGSNIEPRLLHLQAATRRILDLPTGSGPILCSRVYETSPVDCPPRSPLFLNAALEFSTELHPVELLRQLKSIESDLGRPSATERNSPRTIDLDLLYCDNIALAGPELTLPHPQITRRRFVLQPLADIRPELVLPQCTRSIDELLRKLKSNEIVNVFSGAITLPTE
jgi:2-amino-4-hydroxy-6-hydroxymethyldihydropteridine diphosphokinase